MKTENIIFFAIFILFSIFLLGTIDQTGVTYDENVYLNNLLRLTNNTLSFQEHFDQFKPPQHGAFMFLFASPFYLLTKNFLDITTALRVATPFLYLIFLVFFYFFIKKEHGAVSALAGSIILMGMPRVFFHSHLLALDFPVMVLYGIGTILFFKAIQTGRLTWILAASFVLAGLLATKITGYVIFAPLVIYVVYLKIKKVPVPTLKIKNFVVAPAIAVFIVTALFFFIISPPLYNDPLSIINYLTFHGSRAEDFRLFGGYHSQWSLAGLAYVPFTLLTTINSAHIILALFGLLLLHRNKDNKTATPMILLVFWATVAIFSSPFAYKGDAERNFLMLYPFMAFFAGVGVQQVVVHANKIIKQHYALVSSAVIVILLVSSSLTVAYSHPFESSYFNLFVGGTPGVVKHNLHTVTYWQDEFKYAIEWINQLPQNSTITALPNIGPYLWYQSIGLIRNDIKFTDTIQTLPDYIVVPLKEFPIYYGPPSAQKSLEDAPPLYVIKNRQGVELVKIYQIKYA